MESDEDSGDFNETRADLFEAISHPARIRILQTLNEKPMGFAELGRAVGIEGGGHLGFHLRKLTHLVKTTPEGTYALTGDGKEALWSINALRKSSNGMSTKPAEASVKHRDWAKSVLSGLLIALVVFGAVAVYQQQLIITQQGQIASLRNNLAADNRQISDQQKRIALLGDANIQSACTGIGVFSSYPPNATTIRAQIIPLLQTFSAMTINISQPLPGVYAGGTTAIVAQGSSLNYQVASESTSGSLTTYKVNISRFIYNSGFTPLANSSVRWDNAKINDTAWVRSDGFVTALHQRVDQGGPPPTPWVFSYDYTGVNATWAFASDMEAFLVGEYCQSLVPAIALFTSAQLVANGTSTRAFGPSSVIVTGYRAANLPLFDNATSPYTDASYFTQGYVSAFGEKTYLRSITDFAMQVGTLPGTSITLLTYIHLKGNVNYGPTEPFDYTYRITSLTKAAGT